MRIVLCLYLVFCFSNSYSQITVDTGFTAKQLAAKLVGSGLIVSNAKLTAVSNQCGIFRATPNALPLDSGVVLTTGYAKGPKGVSYSSGNTLSDNQCNKPGDSSLNQIFSISNTYDGCVLEFDFIPSGDSINFRYLLSSEEYENYVCSKYNDAFAFIIKGPGFAVPTNIALVPNTNIPVAINSINSGKASPNYILDSCKAMGPGSPFKQYYVNNAGTSQLLAHYGRTKVLTAKAKVIPCNVYNIKLVIADVADSLLDSDVFLEAGSFSSPKEVEMKIVNTVIVSDTATLIERCHPNAKIIMKRDKGINFSSPLDIKLSLGGSAVNGLDFNYIDSNIHFNALQDSIIINLSLTDDGIGDDNEYFTAKIKKNTNCSAFVTLDSAFVNVKEKQIKSSTLDTFVCKNIGKTFKTSLIDTTKATFLWDDNHPFATNFINTTGLHWVNGTINLSCIQSDTFKVSKDNFSIVINDKLDSICRGDSLLLGYKSNQQIISSLWSNGSTDSAINIYNAGKYVITAQDVNKCFDKDSAQISFKKMPQINLPAKVSCCFGDSVLLDATQTINSVYQWSNGANTSKIYVDSAAMYSVKVTTINGCKAIDTSFFKLYDLPTVTIDSFKKVVKGEQLLLDAVASNNAIKFLWTPAFNLTNPNILKPTALVEKSLYYVIKVTTINDCFADDTIKIKALEPDIIIPNVFSPNNDKINDTWEIISLIKYLNASILIFDRYRMKIFESKGYKTPWDGRSMHNGKQVNIGTYYYLINTNDPENNRTYSGWVAVLR